MHNLLEAHYKGEDWRTVHQEMCEKFRDLQDHEKDDLGDLPYECATLMDNYLYHYGGDKDDPLHGWKVHEVELKLEMPWPNGEIFQGKVDLLIEDEFGLWVVDHKNKKRMPDFADRLKDIQSIGYVLAARYNGIPVRGFKWNYLWTTLPTKPALVDVKRKYKTVDGERVLVSEDFSKARLSKQACTTDWRTMRRAISEYGLDAKDYQEDLIRLQRQRYAPGQVQTSPFFRRHDLERPEAQLKAVWKSMYRTHLVMQKYYDFAKGDPDYIERVTGPQCSWCDFRNLCDAEVSGGNADVIRMTQFQEADPMAYYEDTKELDD